MFKNYLAIAWRYNINNGLFSVINILGLAIGLMSCILIMLFVRQESGFDRWIPDANKVVRMHTAYVTPGNPPFLTVRSAGRMMPAIRDFAKNEVADGVRLIHFALTVQKDGDAFSEQVTMVDGSFFNVIDLPFVHGDKNASFNKPFDLLISEEMAIKYFGKTDVVGESLTLCCVRDEATDLIITGVIKDLPQNTHFDINMLVYLQPAIFGENNGVLDTWTSVNVYTYFKLNEGVTPEQLQQRIKFWVNNESPFKQTMKNFMDEQAEGSQISDFTKHRIMPLTDLHLHAKEDAGNMGDFTPMGDARMITTFIIVAALVLLIACINFMNLSTAKATKRAKEVAIRKVLGAERKQLAGQFIAEAVALVMVALLLALVAVELVLPLYSQVLGKEIELQLLDDPQLLLSLIGLTLVVGIGSGIYPAAYLSKFRPAKVLKSNKSADSGHTSSLRNALVVFQFATSIILVISTIVVYGQTLYSNSLDVGFESNNKLVLNLAGIRDNRDSLRQQLLAHPDIKSVTFSSEAPTQDNENNNYFTLVENLTAGGQNEGQLLNYHNMGYGFFNAYQVQPIAGRLFDEAFGSDELVRVEQGQTAPIASAILNESAIHKLGFANAEQAIGKTLKTMHSGSRELTIIGVIPDIYFRSIKFEIRPTVFMLEPARFRVANIEFSANNLNQLQQDIEQIWKQVVPMQPVNLQFLSSMMSAQYAEDLAQARLFLGFSVLAIFIACLGLYGLAAYTAERRTKEIGIRKVMGASIKDIIQILVWQFSKPVLLANLIAWPVSFYFMSQWLQGFQYRLGSEFIIAVLFIASALALLVAWLTVASRAFRVAKANPIKALRYE